MELRQSSCFRNSSAESMGSLLLVAASEDGFSLSAASDPVDNRGPADSIKINPSLLILLESKKISYVASYILGVKTNGAASRDLLGPTFAGRPSIRSS